LRPPILTRSGLEAAIVRPLAPSAQFTISGRLIGLPSDDFARQAHEDLPQIVEAVRNQLQNQSERRVHPRFQTELPILAYPLYPDGFVGAPIGGTCKDISVSGIRLITSVPIRTERFYVEFHELQPLAGLAVYVRVVRTMQDKETQGTLTTGRFKMRV
jgi:hypothetical protein